MSVKPKKSHKRNFKEEDRRPFLDTAIELRKWFNNQSKWSTQKEFADDIGIPYSSMKKIFQGQRAAKGENRRKLYEATKLTIFFEGEKDRNPKSTKQVSNTVESAFYELANALEPFKYMTAEQRANVKERIPVEDVGYVSSFLKAIYDEDKFSDFIFFTEYMKRRTKNE